MHVRRALRGALLLSLVFGLGIGSMTLSPIPPATADPVPISRVAVGANGRPYLQVDGQPYLYLSVENWGKQQLLGGCDRCANWRYSLPQFTTPMPTSWLENVFEKTKAAGYNTISMILDWNQIEPTTQGSFDWSLVDQYIAWAVKYDLRIDWVWFGSLNECGTRMPPNTNGWMTWVPTYVQDQSKYFGRAVFDQDVYCAWLPDGGTHTADANYLFDSEKNAVANLFAHLATVDTSHRTILFQDENEPNLHPDWATTSGKTIIRNILGNLAQVVKQSAYPVAVRINVAGYANDDFNNIPYVDFQGTDLYSGDPYAVKASVVNPPHSGPLGGIAENDGGYSNISTLATTAIINGAYYDSFQLNDHFPPQGLYDSNSSYYVNWTLGTIPALRSGAARMQRELSAINKISTIAATASPEQMNGFNIDGPTPLTTYTATKLIGRYQLGFSTTDGAVGVAFNKGNSLYLSTDSTASETFTSFAQPTSVGVGHLDGSGTWVQDASRGYTNNGNGTYSVSVNQGEVVRLSQPMPAIAQTVAQWKLGEGSGTSAADASGNGHTGTLNGGTTWVGGLSGSALQFDGSSGYVSAGWNQLSGNAPRTISTWFRTTSTANSNWISWGTNNANGLSQLGVFQGNVGYLGYANDLTVPLAGYADGNWHQLATTFNGVAMALYLDGKLVAAQPMTLATGSSSTISIGRSITGSDYFTGALDEIAIYNQALDSDQIKAQFPATVAYWGDGEGSGTAVSDASGNARTGTLSGGAAWTTGVSGYGLQFDGSTGYASAGWNQLSGNAARTISTWFTTTNTANSDWVSWGTDNANGLSQLGIYQGGIGYLGYANDLTVPAAGYADGNWHQLTVTFDGSTMLLYLDGAQVATKSTTLATGASSLIDVGRSITAASDQYFGGSLDETAVYPQALTAAQVAALYNAR
jgi:hypothetical protein